MRDLKFRIWVKVWEKMYRVASLIFAPSGELKSLEIYLFEDSKFPTMIELEGTILMQYTGLHTFDSSTPLGNEIYEDDIVEIQDRYSRDTYIGQIVWNQDYACWSINGNDLGPELMNASSVRIVGNIYMNPNLLEE